MTIWGSGTYDNALADKPVPQTVTEGIKPATLSVSCSGQKLRGRFARSDAGQGHGKESWLLMKDAGSLCAEPDEAR